MTFNSFVKESYTLYEACKDGNLDWIKQNQAQLRFLDMTQEELSPFCVAIRYGNLNIAQWLVLESGSEININETTDWALQIAAGKGYLNIVKWLLCAAEKDCVRAAQKFEFQAKVSVPDVTLYEYYAIRFAASQNHLEVVKYLVLDSDQTVDCRECDTWKVDTVFSAWSESVQSFLRTVQQLQNCVGVENWKEAYHSMELKPRLKRI